MNLNKILSLTIGLSFYLLFSTMIMARNNDCTPTPSANDVAKLTACADRGYSDSQALLGMMYVEGYLEKDINKGLKYYKLAAAQGKWHAAHKIGNIYEKKNQAAVAYRWYLIANYGKFSNAKYSMNKLHWELTEAVRNVEKEKAIKWIRDNKLVGK